MEIEVDWGWVAVVTVGDADIGVRVVVVNVVVNESTVVVVGLTMVVEQMHLSEVPEHVPVQVLVEH
jgi:hypothetical protein